MTTIPQQRRTLSTTTGAAYSRIWGVGGYRPERVVTNEEICEHIDSSDQWIRERSGIITRRYAAPDETVVDMASAAATEALRSAGLTASQISTVIVATVTHPYQTPGAAPIVAERIGATSAVAFDISAACAGYCHGIALANDMVRGGSAKFVLVIGVEKLSDFTDKTDRGSAFIFGDGAGAAIVGPSDFPGIGPTVWGSDGSKWKTISQRNSWIEVRDGGVEWPAITMEGPAVFRWAVWDMAPIAQAAAARALSLLSGRRMPFPCGFPGISTGGRRARRTHFGGSAPPGSGKPSYRTPSSGTGISSRSPVSTALSVLSPTPTLSIVKRARRMHRFCMCPRVSSGPMRSTVHRFQRSRPADRSTSTRCIWDPGGAMPTGRS